jgi:predicted dehydrogenase
MSQPNDRRTFLRTAALASGAALLLHKRAAADPPSERVRLGIMGLNGRGTDLARAFAQTQGAAVAWLCDVDERAISKAAAAIGSERSSATRHTGDFRKILDDPAVDALVIATPDHWHAPATILACAAGKHVYVEKPASHNAREGELMVAAARKANRVVQLGTQRRSDPAIVEAIGRLRGGEIGRVLLARSWYAGGRGSIGRGRETSVPSWLDYSLWQGPAPERAYRDNVVHYQWHWFWHWGTGELGNNGIHGLDVCRWGLGVDYPQRVTAGGGKFRFDDDQETPDTHLVTFDFGSATIGWEARSWHRSGVESSGFGSAFYGERGSLVIDDDGCRFLSADGKQVTKVEKPSSGEPHLENFLAAVRGGAKPNAEIAEGHKSTLLCHLGNIAYRTGRALRLDGQTHQIAGDAEAAALWSREYRPGWEPKV